MGFLNDFLGKNREVIKGPPDQKLNFFNIFNWAFLDKSLGFSKDNFFENLLNYNIKEPPD